MTRVALDASALLAMLLGEPGGEKVRAVLEGALLCTVNLAEIVSHYAKLGASRPDIEAMLQPLPIQVVPVDAALSYQAGMLRPLTLPGGLSLGDRYCLALAKREGIAALTAERRWPDIAVAADVTVDLIR
ncbi:MAG TPA: type II toxin-antitoxin system VapC family toxin [Acetobacteraceae bacterium]|nr:type II toxin-antitoxin system VapC family toxin [Acetobacteraceae bacterium]